MFGAETRLVSASRIIRMSYNFEVRRDADCIGRQRIASLRQIEESSHEGKNSGEMSVARVRTLGVGYLGF